MRPIKRHDSSLAQAGKGDPDVHRSDGTVDDSSVYGIRLGFRTPIRIESQSRTSVQLKRPGETVTVIRSRIVQLSPGDSIEYSLTAEIKHYKKGNWWVKVGGTTVIRDGETTDKAKARLRNFVHDTLEEASTDILE